MNDEHKQNYFWFDIEIILNLHDEVLNDTIKLTTKIENKNRKNEKNNVKIIIVMKSKCNRGRSMDSILELSDLITRIVT